MENKSDITLEDKEVVIDGNFAIHEIENDTRQLEFNAEQAHLTIGSKKQSGRMEIISKDEGAKIVASAQGSLAKLTLGGEKTTGTINVDGGGGQAGIILRGLGSEISTWNEKGKVHDINTKENYVWFANANGVPIFDLKTDKTHLDLNNSNGKNCFHFDLEGRRLRIKDKNERNTIWVDGEGAKITAGSAEKAGEFQLLGPGSNSIKMVTNGGSSALFITDNLLKEGRGLLYSTGNGKLIIMKGDITITGDNVPPVSVAAEILSLKEQVAELRRDLDALG